MHNTGQAVNDANNFSRLSDSKSWIAACLTGQQGGKGKIMKKTNVESKGLKLSRITVADLRGVVGGGTTACEPAPVTKTTDDKSATCALSKTF